MQFSCDNAQQASGNRNVHIGVQDVTQTFWMQPPYKFQLGELVCEVCVNPSLSADNPWQLCWR